MPLATELSRLATAVGQAIKALQQGAPAERTSSADVSTASTTPTEISGLSWTGLPAGSYVLDAYLMTRASSTLGGPRFSLAGNADLLVAGHLDVATSATARTVTPVTSPGTAVGTNHAAAGTPLPTKLHAVVVLPTTGPLTLRVASSITTSTATVQRLSYAVLSRI